MEIIQLLLFIMIILTLLNGLVFFKKLIKLQEETNALLRKLLKNQNCTDNKIRIVWIMKSEYDGRMIYQTRCRDNMLNTMYGNIY